MAVEHWCTIAKVREAAAEDWPSDPDVPASRAPKESPRGLFHDARLRVLPRRR